MTKEQIRTKFDRWAERVEHTPFENDLDNATLLLSYDDKQTSTTFSTVAVYAVAVHTDHCLLYTSPSPRDVEESRMPSSA